MKKLMLAGLTFVFLAAVVMAQESAKPEDANAAAKQGQEHKSKSHMKSVTGCLQKGVEPGEFSITGEDGKTWGLRSKTVKLEQHVGHRVTVTGSAHRESEAQEKSEEKKEGRMENAAGKEEYGDLRVTDLKMISDTCNK